MEFNFTGKTAIVTGGSRGIGKAIAERMLQCGASVLITSTAEAPAWLKDHPRATRIPMNFLDPGSVEEGMRAIAALPQVDILVNNAGIHGARSIDEIEDEIWRCILEVNVSAPMRMMCAIAPKMKARKQGRILNISSISGIIARPKGGAYSASKAALLGLTRAVALDLAPFNILVNAVCPGCTETDMFEQALTLAQKEILRKESALLRAASPEEVANIALFLCSDLNTYITGQAIVADGGTIIQ